MTKCCWQGCKQDATCVPEINVPAQRWPIDSHKPLSCLTSLAVCEEHYAKIDLKELLETGGPFGEGLKAPFIAAASGRQPPDFERAWLSKVPLNSAKYKDFRQKYDKHKAAQEAAASTKN